MTDNEKKFHMNMKYAKKIYYRKSKDGNDWLELQMPQNKTIRYYIKDIKHIKFETYKILF